MYYEKMDMAAVMYQSPKSFFCSQQILCLYEIVAELVHAFELHREEDSACKRNLSAIELQSSQISRH